MLKEKVANLQKNAADENQKWNYQLEEKLRKLRELDRRYKDGIEEEIKDRQEADTELSKLIEDKFQAFSNEIEIYRNGKNENFKELFSCVESDIPGLRKQLGQVTEEREKEEEKIQNNMNEVMDDLYSQLDDHRKMKEEEEKIIFDLLKEVVEKIKKEIEQEKKDREETEQTILNLLEGTCDKLADLNN